MASDAVVFECSQFSLRRENRPLFAPIEVRVVPGTVVLLSGANGIGKSSLLSFLSGQRVAMEGQLIHRPHPESTLFLTQLQAFRTQLPYSLHEVAQFIAFNRSSKSTLLSFPETTTESARPSPWLSAELCEKSWNHASGGERMRALLAGALSSAAQVLLLDEPFNHLDAEASEAAEKAIVEYCNQPEFKAKALFLVSHAPTPILLSGLAGRCINLELKRPQSAQTNVSAQGNPP